MDRKEIKPVLKFIEAIKKSCKPVKIYLFGSRARGEGLAESDYDFLIISPVFRNLPYLKRGSKVLRHHPRTVSIDIVCLTPEEFELELGKPTLVQSIVDEGIELTATT